MKKTLTFRQAALLSVLLVAILAAALGSYRLSKARHPFHGIPKGDAVQVSLSATGTDPATFTSDQLQGWNAFLALNPSLTNASSANAVFVTITNSGNTKVSFNCFTRCAPWYHLYTKAADHWQMVPLRYASTTATMLLVPRTSLTFPVLHTSNQTAGLELTYKEQPNRSSFRDFWNRYCHLLHFSRIERNEQLYTTGIIEIP